MQPACQRLCIGPEFVLPCAIGWSPVPRKVYVGQMRERRRRMDSLEEEKNGGGSRRLEEEGWGIRADGVAA